MLGAAGGGGKAANVLQLSVAFLAMMALMFITAVLQPYEKDEDDFLWTASLAALCIAVYAAVFQSAKFDEDVGLGPSTLGAILVLVGLLPPLIAGYILVRDPLSKCFSRRRQQRHRNAAVVPAPQDESTNTDKKSASTTPRIDKARALLEASRAREGGTPAVNSDPTVEELLAEIEGSREALSSEH